MTPPIYDVPYARLVVDLGCGSAPSALDCLRTVSADAILQLYMARLGDIALLAELPLPFGVVQDGDFYHDLPSEILKSKQIAKIPLIIGTNLDEGTMFAAHDITSESELVDFIARMHNAFVCHFLLPSHSLSI